MAAGTYVVEVVPPAGARFTVPKQGPDASDSDVDAAGRASVEVIGGATAAVDAGLVRADSPAADRIAAAQGVPVTLNVLDNDGVPGRATGATLPPGWTWTRVDGPAWGSVACQPNGSCTYHAVSNYAGPDGFRYTLTNPLYGAATVDVTITVSPVNDPPVARDDRAVTGAGRPVTVPVTANDADPNDPFVAGDVDRPGDPPTVAGVGAVTPAGAGGVTCDGRSCTFSPAPGFTGVARFAYTVVDKGVPTAGGPANPLSAQATVEVWVDPDQPALTGFSGDESADVAASTAAWAPTTQAVANGLCADGRPRVAVTWQPVPRATGYRLERRAGGRLDRRVGRGRRRRRRGHGLVGRAGRGGAGVRIPGDAPAPSLGGAAVPSRRRHHAGAQRPCGLLIGRVRRGVARVTSYASSR